MRLTPRRWRLLLWLLMFAGVLYAVRPLTSPYSPETLFLHSDKLAHVLFFGGLWMMARRGGFAAAWPLVLTLLGYGVVISVITFLSVIVGELVPKQLALRNAEAIASVVAASPVNAILRSPS